MNFLSDCRALALMALLCLAIFGFAPRLQGQLVRFPNTSLNLPADLPGGTFTTANAFPGLSFTDPVAIVTPPGETNRLFVLEKPGRIIVIPDLSNPAKQTFLDITAVTNPGGEEGLLVADLDLTKATGFYADRYRPDLYEERTAKRHPH